MNDDLNMSIRKFLKEVGVTSQNIIEKSWDNKNLPPGTKVNAKIVLTIDDLDIIHVVNGRIGS